MALIVVVVVSNVPQPDASMHINPATHDIKAVSTCVARAYDATIVAFLMNIIPDAIVGIFAKSDTLRELRRLDLYKAWKGPVMDLIKL